MAGARRAIKAAAAVAAQRPPANFTRTIRIPKAAEIIAGHIRRMIIRGELSEGDFLEPQGQLINSYSVSRPTIREAFRILESEDLITVSRGSRTGARVHRPKSDVVARQAGVVLAANGTTLRDVYESREVVEPWAARLLARNPRPASIVRLRACIQAARDVMDDPVRFTEETNRFHETLVELSGNHTMSLLIMIVRDLLHRHEMRVAATVRASFGADAQKKMSNVGVRSLEKLVELIEARDEHAAEEHWRLHLENANKLWLGNYREMPIVELFE
jgi:DNA-binding FadR family transcriptional regulator